MKPLLSIVIPLYNTKEFIEPCLNSILESTSTDYEVIVVDDGSTDGSDLIVDKYADIYPQVRVIHQSNSGVAATRNNGLDQAKGEYIWFVDSDDMIAPESLSVVISCLKSNLPECLVISFKGIKESYEMSAMEAINYVGVETEELYSVIGSLSNRAKYNAVPWQYICLNKIYQENSSLRFNKNICYEDELFVPLLLSNLKSCLLLDLPIYLYRKREGSFMNRPINRKQIESRYIIAMELYDHFRDREEWKWIKPRIFNLLINVAKKSLVSGNERYFNDNFRTRVYFRVLRQAISSKRALLEYCILRVNSKLFFYYM